MMERLKSPVSWLWKGDASGHFAKVAARVFSLGLTNNQLRAYELLCCVRDADGVVRRSSVELMKALGWTRSSWDKAMRGLRRHRLIQTQLHIGRYELLEVEAYALGHWRTEGRSEDKDEKVHGAWAKVPLSEIMDERLGGSERRVLGWYRAVCNSKTGELQWSAQMVAKVLGISEPTVKRTRQQLKRHGYIESEQGGIRWRATTRVLGRKGLEVGEVFPKKESGEVDENGQAPKLIRDTPSSCAEIDTPKPKPLSSNLSPFVPPATLELYFALSRIIPSHPDDNPKVAAVLLQRRLKDGADPKAILRKAHLYRDHADFHLPIHVFLGSVFDKWFPPLIPASYRCPSAYRSPASKAPDYQPPSIPPLPEVTPEQLQAQMQNLDRESHQRRQQQLEQRRQAKLELQRQAQLDQELLEQERERTRKARDAFKEQMGW